MLVNNIDTMCMQDQKATCAAVISAKELEIVDKNRQICSLRDTCAALQAQIDSLQTAIQSVQVSGESVLTGSMMVRVLQISC